MCKQNYLLSFLLHKFVYGTSCKAPFKDADGTAVRGFIARVDGDPVGLVAASLNQGLTGSQIFAGTLLFHVKKSYRGTPVPNLLLENVVEWPLNALNNRWAATAH